MNCFFSDRGGGIPRSKADKIFRYMYSTAPRPVSFTDSQHSGPTPLAGFGYGLPIVNFYFKIYSKKAFFGRVDFMLDILMVI
jgi:pyruvate dehydrogenase kinase 2/3/4